MATDDVSVLLTLVVTSHALATLLRLHPHISIETKDVITSKVRRLEIGPVGYPETSVSNDHYTLRHISEDHRSLPCRRGSLKSATELATAVILSMMQQT
jgi:hypothetical protein